MPNNGWDRGLCSEGCGARVKEPGPCHQCRLVKSLVRTGCDRCGYQTLDLHCKVVCPNCGYKRDCSDP